MGDPVASHGNAQTPKAEEMCNRLKAVVYEYSDCVPLALVIGVMEIVKAEILAEAK